MISIFDNKILEQPKDYEFLWRFIKPSRIDALLNGEIYFPSLFQYNDYLESISPLHHFLISIRKRFSEYNFKEWSKSNIRIEKFFTKMELANIEFHMKSILENNDPIKNLEVFYESLKNIEKIEKEHQLNQENIFTSCWFIGDKSESALMWSSYSEPKGIAIRIRFDKFKELIQSYFSNPMNTSNELLKNIYAGKVKYQDFSKYVEWMSELKSGRPLAFFKHKSFNQENEYRILVDLTKMNLGFKKSHKIINPIFFEDIVFILHPSSNHNDLEHFRKRFSLPSSQVILLSNLTFRQNL